MDYSIMIVCDRYLQRLNLVLRNWLAQDVAADSYEILISSSLPDDGVRNYVKNVAVAYPQHSLTLIENESGRTKLEYQETLIAKARGHIFVLVDADMVFPTRFLSYVRDLRIEDGCCVWLGRAYLTLEQTYRAILGNFDLLDPALFVRPLQGEIENAVIYEKETTGCCHIYTRQTFEASGGYEGIEVWGGRYGGFASRLLRKMESLGTLNDYQKIEDFVALHLWHGIDDGHQNWDGTDILW